MKHLAGRSNLGLAQNQDMANMAHYLLIRVDELIFEKDQQEVFNHAAGVSCCSD